MKILITGHRGFIGRETCRILSERGHFIVGVDHNVATKHNPWVSAEFIEPIDYGIREILFSKKIEAVIHLAGEPDAGRCQADPEWSYRNNVDAAQIIARTCDFLGINTLVYGSSAAVAHDRVALNAKRVYSRDVALAEWFFMNMASVTSRFILRYHNVYGPGAKSGVIKLWMDAKNAGTIPRMTGDGDRLRDYIHVTDVAWANVLAVEKPPVNRMSAIDICSGASVNLKQLAELMGIRNYVSVPPNEGDPYHIAGQNDFAKQVIGWEPKRVLTDELEKLMK